ncbi:MAG: hypothetical protein ACKOZW_06355, partial [Cyanobium sp.]
MTEHTASHRSPFGLHGVTFVGSGRAVPSTRVSNEALCTLVDSSDDWIRSRTGIGARRLAGPGETVTTMATAAAQAALQHA